MKVVDPNKFSERLQLAFSEAYRYAKENKNPEITTIHFLKTILEADTIDGLLDKLNLNKYKMIEIIKTELNNQIVTSNTSEPNLGRDVSSALFEANKLAESFGDSYLSVAVVFIELLFNNSLISNKLINEFSIKKEDVINVEIARRKGAVMDSPNKEINLEALEKYGHNLVEEVAAGKIDPVIGRDDE